MIGVTYDANGGSGAPGSQTKEHGQTLTLSSQTPTRYGYSFLGWSRSSTATSASFSPGGSYTGNSDATLYAVWDPNQYTVTLNANGGSFSVSELTKYYGKTLKLPSEIPARDGYLFLGWSTDKNAKTANYSAGGNYTSNSSCTLYAVWEKELERYAVYFNANGGTDAPETMTKTEGVTLILPEIIPLRNGYYFMGWATSPTSATASYSAGDSYTNDASVTLYAIWSPYVYTVMYDANGGSGAPEAQNKTHDVTITLQPDIPYREHYKFLGWNLVDDATEPLYYPGDLYGYEGNVTLYAVWEYINYDLSVSELTVTPDEVRQYEIVHVRFCMDSWDQKNAYENISVEVILNGNVVYSTTADFAAYGVNYGAFITGITQNVEDLLQSHTARTMLANSELVVMLNQAATDRAELADLMGISDLQMSYITGVEAGHGLVKIGSALVPFVNRVPKDTMLFQLMNTKPGEA